MRFRHTIGVADTSACLASRYGVDMQKAYISGLLHDCAKCVPDEQKITECEQNNIEITKSEYESPYLLFICVCCCHFYVHLSVIYLHCISAAITARSISILQLSAILPIPQPNIPAHLQTSEQDFLYPFLFFLSQQLPPPINCRISTTSPSFSTVVS